MQSRLIFEGTRFGGLLQLPRRVGHRPASAMMRGPTVGRSLFDLLFISYSAAPSPNALAHRPRAGDAWNVTETQYPGFGAAGWLGVVIGQRHRIHNGAAPAASSALMTECLSFATASFIGECAKLPVKFGSAPAAISVRAISSNSF